MSQTPRISFVAELRGEVNGYPVYVEGEGNIVKHLGVTAGTYFLKQLPPDFDPRLLAACLVTGYPSACPDLPNIKNPFSESAYEYDRCLVSAHGNHMDLNVRCDYQNGQLISYFNVSGTFIAPSLGSLAPTTETWTRARSNNIDAHFRMVWALHDSQTLVVDATSNYCIKSPLAIPDRLTRNIDVRPTVFPNSIFSLFQTCSIA